MATVRNSRTSRTGQLSEDDTSRTEGIARFWTWFIKHQQHLHASEAHNDRRKLEHCYRLRHEFVAQLQRIHHGIEGRWEITSDHRALVLGGSTLAATPAILETAKAAPSLPGWNVYLFGSPWWLQAGLPKEGLQAPYDVWCTVRLAGRRQPVAIYCGNSESKASARAEYATLMLDFLYGKTWPRKPFHSCTYVPASSAPSHNSLFPADMLTLGVEQLKRVAGE